MVEGTFTPETKVSALEFHNIDGQFRVIYQEEPFRVQPERVNLAQYLRQVAAQMEALAEVVNSEDRTGS